MQIKDLYAIFQQHPSIQTDTRKLKKDDIFFALKGPNFNGNQFVKQALEAGAAYVIIDEDISFSDSCLLQVDDALKTLQDLAKYHRQQFHIPFIAITGSNGKTTTKELVHEVLSTTYQTYTTKGNLNNHIGVPLTILSVKQDAEMAIIEMGANHQKEIESYCHYTMPTHGLITNCGKAHLEGFGGEEGVRKGKGELFDYLAINNGTAFIMNDYAYLQEMSKNIPHIKTYGTLRADVTGIAVEDRQLLEVQMTYGTQIKTLRTHLAGNYNLPNVLAAICVGKYFNVADQAITTALENYAPSNSRSQLVEKGSNKVIMDAYNANPTSMKAAIENLEKMDGANKVLLLGGMMELGEDSIQEHAGIIKLIDQYKWKDVVLVGGDFKKVNHSYTYFDTSTEARGWLQSRHFENTWLLIKGSRSTQMEKVLE